MATKEDILDSFDEAAEDQSTWITIGDGARCNCLLVDGIETDTETRGGRYVPSVRATVIVSSAGFSVPNPGTRGKLESDGQSYSVTVSDESITKTGAGALIQFGVTSN